MSLQLRHLRSARTATATSVSGRRGGRLSCGSVLGSEQGCLSNQPSGAAGVPLELWALPRGTRTGVTVAEGCSEISQASRDVARFKDTFAVTNFISVTEAKALHKAPRCTAITTNAVR